MMSIAIIELANVSPISPTTEYLRGGAHTHTHTRVLTASMRHTAARAEAPPDRLSAQFAPRVPVRGDATPVRAGAEGERRTDQPHVDSKRAPCACATRTSRSEFHFKTLSFAASTTECSHARAPRHAPEDARVALAGGGREPHVRDEPEQPPERDVVLAAAAADREAVGEQPDDHDKVGRDRDDGLEREQMAHLFTGCPL